jgi:hypothetical protein
MVIDAIPGDRSDQYDLKDPRVIQGTFPIGHDIGWNTVAQVGHAGSHALTTTGMAELGATPRAFKSLCAQV